MQYRHGDSGFASVLNTAALISRCPCPVGGIEWEGKEGHARGTGLREAPADDNSHEAWPCGQSGRDVWFEAKVVPIGPKWDKSRACSDQISVYFEFILGEPKYIKIGHEKDPIYPISGQSDPLLSQN